MQGELFKPSLCLVAFHKQFRFGLDFSDAMAILGRSINRKALWWSVVGTILLLPLASALFLYTFDRGAPINAEIALTFPFLIFRYQGFLVGTIVNVGMLAFTFVPLFLLLNATLFRNNETILMENTGHSRSSPKEFSLPARVLAGINVILGTVLAITTIDYPLISLAIMAPSYAVAYGLFTTRRWGWYLAMFVYSAIMVGGFVAYAFGAIMAIRDLGRPRGHMELFSGEAVLIVITIAFVIFEILASLPILLLRRNSIRRKFHQVERAGGE